MKGSSEVVLEELRVSTKLRQGSERLRLLFTDRRLVVDHVGKRGAGAVPGTNILGKLSTLFEDLFKSRKESVSRRQVENMEPSQVLRANRDNFAIQYDEIVSAAIEQTPDLNSLEILTRDDKFEFLTRSKVDAVAELFSKTLGDKFTMRRLC